jgi:UDPglucose--hexose-1-phosphate uridylyltransferase
MSELRKDYILDRFVIIAVERAKRPDQFRSDPDEKPLPKEKCFFCPGNENTTPPEILRYPVDGSWNYRVFDNKFSAVGSGDKIDLRTDNSYYTYADAVGKHEVIVETEDHAKSIWDFSAEEMARLFRIYSERIQAIEKMPGVKYVQVFKNHGKSAGTSIQHSHSQIIAYNLMPSVVREEEEACGDVCQYCRIIREEASSPRAIMQNSGAFALAPYASRYPFESWVFPKRHIKRIDELTDSELLDFSEALLTVLRKLRLLQAHYNLVIHYGTRRLHFHVEVLPRLATWAGFELATGTIINSMPPEKAAEYYRGQD